MKKALEILLNKVFKKDLCLLYGDDCYVVVNRIYFSDYHKEYIVDCKLMVKNDEKIDFLHEVYPDGLKFITEESWKFMGLPEKTRLISTLDFI